MFWEDFSYTWPLFVAGTIIIIICVYFKGPCKCFLPIDDSESVQSKESDLVHILVDIGLTVFRRGLWNGHSLNG